MTLASVSSFLRSIGRSVLVDSKKRGNLRRVRGAALRPAHEPYEDQLAFLARRAFLSVSASRRR
ncbi:MAG TPA: hypothetical protein VN253_05935, partial [Kofleriaceae bacterium]|nr:hypothetical protein [Kofleriaceae bacterium]